MFYLLVALCVTLYSEMQEFWQVPSRKGQILPLIALSATSKHV